jgi:hypothetical protein
MKKIFISACVFLSACSSNPHKASELNTKIEKAENAGQGAVIGVKDGNMVYQKKVLLGEELRTLTVNARELEAKLYGGPRYFDNNGMIGALKNCRAKLATAKGEKLQWTERRDYVIPDGEDLKMGFDEKGALTGLTEEFLKDRLDRYKGYQKILTQRIDDMDEKIASCNSQLNFANKIETSPSDN